MEPIELLRHFFVTGMSRSRRVHYQLSIIHYQLSIIHYQLSIIHYQLSIIHYQLSIIHYQLIPPFSLCKMSKNRALACPAIAALATADQRQPLTHYHVQTRMQAELFKCFQRRRDSSVQGLNLTLASNLLNAMAKSANIED
jgi:hypothetical protein